MTILQFAIFSPVIKIARLHGLAARKRAGFRGRRAFRAIGARAIRHSARQGFQRESASASGSEAIAGPHIAADISAAENSAE